MKEVLVTVIVVLQYINVGNQHIVYLKFIQMLLVNHISIKLEQHKYTMRADLVLSTLTGYHFLKDSKIKISHNDAF